MNGPLPPPHAGPPPINNGRGGPPPSPPISIARSSNGTGLYPPGNDGGRKYDPRLLEQQLADHHRVLKDYLATSVREDRTYMPHNRARDKLLRLSAIQFQELSTDVYDELLRRQDVQASAQTGANIPRFLLPKNNFHPKRNQARQKLSTLAPKKFRELATDVLFELERRFPRFTGADRVANRGASRPPTANGMYPPGMRRGSNASSVGGPYSPGIIDRDSRGMPGSGRRQFQSNTMVPNKGTMVEDDDGHSVDEDDPYDMDRAGARSSRRATNKSLPYSIRDQPGASEYQTQISELEAKVEEMQAQLQEKDQALENERERSTTLTSNLERQLKSAESLNDSLQAELDRLKVDHEGDNEWKSRYDNLEQQYHEQQQVTEEVRHTAAESLHEMRQLVQHVTQKSGGDENLARRAAELEASVESWRDRHAKTRAHLRSLRSSSTGLFIQQPTAAQFMREGNVLDNKGLVRDVAVTQFQIAIDELLQLARDGEPAQVLPFMRNIVGSVRAVTADVQQTPARGSEEAIKKRKKAEARIAAATNNLITTAKNHAVSSGMAPVSLMDAAASHLSAAVIDLVKMVKVRPTAEHELDDDFN